MTKPVNIMSYDMRDFLVSCVDKYCELAGVGRNSLKFAPTPFHDNKVAEPLKPNEPQGRLPTNRQQSTNESALRGTNGEVGPFALHAITCLQGNQMVERLRCWFASTHLLH